jgi:Uma2 family endonuclease
MPTAPGAPARAGYPIEPGQLLVLDHLPWASYVAIADALPDRPAIRTTFDRGRLELMTTSAGHEFLKTWLTRLIDVLAEECGRAYVSGGNMTFRREDLGQGFEPDNCFWFAAEPALRRQTTYDPGRDPPPELLVEVEVSRRAIPRLPLYAAFGVVEVWRFDGEVLHVHRLQADRTYADADRSGVFPAVPMADLARFFHPDPDRDTLTFIREFRAWVRQVIAPR